MVGAWISGRRRWGVDPFGWSAAGLLMLSRWVLSLGLSPRPRISALLEIVDMGRRHVEMGPLGLQVHRELSQLYDQLDEPAKSAVHRRVSETYRDQTNMTLHLEPFQFPSLLARLPIREIRHSDS